MPNPPDNNHHPSGQIIKYRPAFTLEQLTHLASALQSDMDDPISKSIVRILTPLLAKISNQLIEPAYTLAPPKLPKSSPTIDIDSPQYRYENDLMLPDEQSEYESKLLGL